MLIRSSFILFLLLLPFLAWGQSTDQILQEVEDDVTVGSDIFSDFNEDLESAQVLEDERFYRYGRFFSVNLGGGFTTFTGNRGKAFEDNNPTFHLSMSYFLDFQNAIILGVEYSKHTMVLDTVVHGYKNQGNLGAVTQDMTRVFVGYKYYIDTTDLGTAITYSNPHFIGRLEYWYQTTKFLDQDTIPNDKGGGIGTGIGMGLEFPIELKKSYISVEALYHVVNFYDKYTQDYAQEPGLATSTYGFDDLTGNVMSLIFTYNFTW
ncbi:hypothetical protein ACJVC5_17330 [Peredibacter sp. HCB2-198]|uniref:hypothetical protein n=1 Tax=Peredibacter sp. HCB2-198 TaxID=3383025 RepID=UPI0038B69547